MMTSRAVSLAVRQLTESASLHASVAADPEISETLARWASWCSAAIRANGTIFFAGNGGSFSDAQHLAAELTGKMGSPRDPLPGLALGTNSSSVTAIANDFDYSEVFARECRALARPGSVVVALSTSGNSPSILNLVDVAKELELRVLCLTGASGGRLSSDCDMIRVPSSRTERIQEIHILLGHTLCLLIEDLLFNTAKEQA